MQKKIQYPFNFHSQNTHTHIPSWFKKQWLRTGIKFDLSELDKGLLQNQTKKKKCNTIFDDKWYNILFWFQDASILPSTFLFTIVLEVIASTIKFFLKSN